MRKYIVLIAAGLLPLMVAATTAAVPDPDKATWTHVTGTAQEEEWIGDSIADSTHRWDGSVEYIPGSRGSYTVEWSDPRLPTTMRIQQDAAVHHGDLSSYDDWMWLYTMTVRLDGPDGAWTGSGHGVFGSDGELGLVMLMGEGAYQGSSALFDWSWGDEDYTVLLFDGWILESELPPPADPVEPPAE